MLAIYSWATGLPWGVVDMLNLKKTEFSFSQQVSVVDGGFDRGEIFCPFSLLSAGNLAPEYELSIFILSLDIHQTLDVTIVISLQFHHESSIWELR